MAVIRGGRRFAVCAAVASGVLGAPAGAAAQGQAPVRSAVVTSGADTVVAVTGSGTFRFAGDDGAPPAVVVADGVAPPQTAGVLSVQPRATVHVEYSAPVTVLASSAIARTAPSGPGASLAVVQTSATGAEITMPSVTVPPLHTVSVSTRWESGSWSGTQHDAFAIALPQRPVVPPAGPGVDSGRGATPKLRTMIAVPSSTRCVRSSLRVPVRERWRSRVRRISITVRGRTASRDPRRLRKDAVRYRGCG